MPSLQTDTHTHTHTSYAYGVDEIALKIDRHLVLHHNHQTLCDAHKNKANTSKRSERELASHCSNHGFVDQIAP